MRINYSGLVIAGAGFFLTRLTVTLAFYEDPVRFYLAGVVPLVIGLGLAAFGIALTVADVDASVVRTTALWCVFGATTMLVFVVLTLLGSTTGRVPDLATVRSRAYLSNFLIGGSVGGTLTGLYAARNRSQRAELRRQTDRLEVLNRLLRHEVLNALTAIRGYAGVDRDGTRDARTVIEERSDDIEQTITEVKYLTGGDSFVAPTAVEECLAESVATVRGQWPDADIRVDSDPGAVVTANDRLEHVFTHLLENAVVHTPEENPTVDVSVRQTATTVRVGIRDRGPGLPAAQRRLLETGERQSTTGPGTGFGLHVVRFLVESFDGSIETAVDDGTTVTVVLPRTGEDLSVQPDLSGVRTALPNLLVTLGAALVAGVGYGAVVEAFGGSVSGIGVFYGVQSPVVGWITHQFHSVVFGFVFAGIVSLTPVRYHDHVPAYVVIGTGWALTLWFVAAGFVAPVWLQLLDIPASIPTFRLTLLASHLAWGVSLGLLTVLGYRHLVPWMRRRR